VLPRLLAGEALAAADYARAQAMRGGIVAELLDRLQSVDLFVAPSTPAPAPLLAAGAYVPGDAPWGTEPGPFQLQRLFSLTGFPVVSAPLGLGTQGLPLGVQIAARPWQEGLILGAAAAVMDGVPHARRAPPIAPL
jgi:aspartyl-tRNA(Asn)/glutamyl-tRNA(Gln) amidotransferase subunit A